MSEPVPSGAVAMSILATKHGADHVPQGKGKYRRLQGFLMRSRMVRAFPTRAHGPPGGLAIGRIGTGATVDDDTSRWTCQSWRIACRCIATLGIEPLSQWTIIGSRLNAGVGCVACH
jgi:hypothetical protein